MWQGPTATPTGNNVEAPINVSATAQTKTGDLTAGGLTLSKYPSGGPNSFISPSGTGTKALHLTSGYAGFTDINNLWRWYVLENGDTNQPGKANASDFCINGGGCLGSGGGIPVGGIIMWSGSVANIPSGWKLCDGNNGTPNLSGRFIIGAGSATYTPGATGGSKNAVVVAHSHLLGGHDSNAEDGGNGENTEFVSSYSVPSSDNISTNTVGSSGTNANLPPYYALAFIMRTL